MRARKSRGMALLGMMVLLFFILGIILLATLGRSSGVTTNADAALNQIGQQADAQTAQDLSETGVRITHSWFQYQDTVNDIDIPFAPSTVGNDFYGASVQSGYNVIELSQAPTSVENSLSLAKPSRMRIRIYPGSDPGTGGKIFVIQSIGECGTMQHTSRLVIRPKSFVEYGLFYDEPLSNFVWMAGTHVFTGPVHMNMRAPGTNTVDTTATHRIIWNTTNPLFTFAGTNYFTCAGAPSQINWWKGLITPQTPVGSDWAAIATAGTPPQFNVPVIPFPQSTSSMKSSALSGATAPSAPGVLIPHSTATLGGIYIAGSVTGMALSTSGSNNINQILTFSQTSGMETLRSVITINRESTTTRLQTYTKTNGTETLTLDETYNGITNGLVYVDGDIGNTTTLTGGLSGVVANSASVDTPSFMTIATPTECTIQFNGSVSYQRLVNGGTSANPLSTATQADSRCGVLGIIMGRQRVVDNDSSGATIQDISLHGALMALNADGGTPSTSVTNYKTRPGGKCYLLGAVAIKKDGAFGYFTYDNAGNIVSQNGFNRQRLYDLRFTDIAPPFFPVAPRTYHILSYQSGVTALP